MRVADKLGIIRGTDKVAAMRSTRGAGRLCIWEEISGGDQVTMKTANRDGGCEGPQKQLIWLGDITGVRVGSTSGNYMGEDNEWD